MGQLDKTNSSRPQNPDSGATASKSFFLHRRGWAGRPEGAFGASLLIKGFLPAGVPCRAEEAQRRAQASLGALESGSPRCLAPGPVDGHETFPGGDTPGTPKFPTAKWKEILPSTISSSNLDIHVFNCLIKGKFAAPPDGGGMISILIAQLASGLPKGHSPTPRSARLPNPIP